MLSIIEEKNLIDLPTEIISTVIISQDKKNLLIFVETKNILYNYSLINSNNNNINENSNINNNNNNMNNNNSIKLINTYFFPKYYDISNIYFSNLNNNVLLTKKNLYTIYQYNLNDCNFNYAFIISKFEKSVIDNIIINPNIFSKFKDTFISIDIINRNIKVWVNENNVKFLAIEINNVLNVNYEPKGNYFVTITNNNNSNKNYMNIFLFEEKFSIEKLCNLEINVKSCKDIRISKNKLYLVILDEENRVNLYFLYNCKLLKQLDLNDEYIFDVIILVNNFHNSIDENKDEFIAYISKNKVFKLLKLNNLDEVIEYKMPNTNFNLDYLQILDINNNKIWTIFFDEKKFKIFNYK